MKKVLIIYASAGNGHRTAAKALEEAFLTKYSNQIEVRLVDVLEYSNLVYRQSYSKSYWAMINYAPQLWGVLYDKTDEADGKSLSTKVVSAFDKLNTIKLTNLVEEYEPDHIISTHYLPADVLSKKRMIDHSVVITDYQIHSYWLREGVDNYFVASNTTKKMLHFRSDFPQEKIQDFGIPVALKFSKKHSKKDLLKKLGLDSSKKTLLVYCEGVWLKAMREYIDELKQVKIPLNVIFLSGKRKSFERELRQLEMPENITKKVVGFVPNMEEILEVSDLVVTKPGGLMVTECLAMGKPMLLVLPIPGQEDGNADFLMEHGAALRGKDPLTFRCKLEYLFEEKKVLKNMKKKALEISKPRASLDIADFVVKEKLGL